MSSKLLLAMNGLIDVFYLYSGKEGDKYKLSKLELKNLLQVELAYLLEDNKDNVAVDQIMKELDENNDGEVDFKEFVILVVALTVTCSDFFVQFDKFCQKKAAPADGGV